MSKSEQYTARGRRPAIFIAMEGVVWDRRELSERLPDVAGALAGAMDGLRLLTQAETPIYLVALDGGALKGDPCAALAEMGIRTAGLVVCPRRDDIVSRRKALARELRMRARRDHIALESSLLIGDTWSLAEAALGLGCQPVLVMTGRGRAQIAQPQTTSIRARTWYAADLALAASSILAHLLAQSHPFTMPRQRGRAQTTVA